MALNRILWHYLPELPDVAPGQEGVAVMASREPLGEGQPTVWMAYFTRKGGFRAAKGHPLKRVYAWAYFPEPAAVLAASKS